MTRDYPVAPHNVFCISPYVKNSVDIRWDNPGVLPDNSQFHVLGANVYRAFDSEYGPFKKLNDLPVGGAFYRDQIKLDVVIGEDVSTQFIHRGDNQSGNWTFSVKRLPIMKQAANTEAFIYADNVRDIELKIDGVVVPAFRIRGRDGQIDLIANKILDSVTQKLVDPVLPGPNSVVTCTYRTTLNSFSLEMFQRVFYRVTTVASDGVETPVDQVTSVSAHEIEKLDYIWREAIRRNRWILEQGGERVKVFIRRHTGVECKCWNPTKQQPLNDCVACFGTGVLGGYDGPYDMLICPDEGKKKRTQGNLGQRLEHSWEAWTGPSPLLSHRDFIVRQNGDRYSIGAPSIPSARGMVLQQHYTMNYVDYKDIRHKVPVAGVQDHVYPQTRLQTNGSNVYPEITEKQTIPDEREERGRTVVWENITY